MGEDLSNFIVIRLKHDVTAFLEPEQYDYEAVRDTVFFEGDPSEILEFLDFNRQLVSFQRQSVVAVYSPPQP